MQDTHVDWSRALVLVWGAGALFMWVTLAWGALRLRQTLRERRVDAPAWLMDEIDALCAEVGLEHSPRIQVVDANVSPAVFAFGPLRHLIVPAHALRLPERGRHAIWIHELAHLMRGDVHVRWIECAARVALWWHPVAWWLVRGLRDAEERACDAVVVHHRPSSRRAYCEALLDFDELTTRTTAISHAGGVGCWQRRLEAIMKPTTPLRPRSAWLCIALCGLSFGLGLHAQDPAAPTESWLDATTARPFVCEEPTPLREWAKRVAEVSGCEVIVSAAASERKADLTTLHGLRLPATEVRRLLDVVTTMSGLSWTQKSARVVQIDANQPTCRVDMLGAFQAPGGHHFRQGVTLLEALTRSAVTKTASFEHVTVLDPRQATSVMLDVKKMIRTGDTAANVVLRDGNTVFIPDRTTGLSLQAPPSHLQVGSRVRFLVDPAAKQRPGAELLAHLEEEQVVGVDGTILVPYVGQVRVHGLDAARVSQVVHSALREVFTFDLVLHARFLPAAAGR